VSDCYIYYRVAAEHEHAARLALHAMLAELEVGIGVVGHAYRKASEPLLWMEVYTVVADPEALVGLLNRLAERHGLIHCLAENQRRHVEHFLPFDSQ
jgi:aldehyde:ferredoxin oxidoreductase